MILWLEGSIFQKEQKELRFPAIGEVSEAGILSV